MITTEEGDKMEEMDHLRGALRVCGYRTWAFKRVKHKIGTKDQEHYRRQKLQEASRSLRESRREYLLRKYELQEPCVPSPHSPQAYKGKVELEEQGELVISLIKNQTDNYELSHMCNDIICSNCTRVNVEHSTTVFTGKRIDLIWM